MTVAHFAISQDSTLDEIQEYLKKNGDVNARVRNPRWFETSSGQLLALNLLAIPFFLLLWVVTRMTGMGGWTLGLIIGPAFYSVSQLLPRRFLFGYSRLGASIALGVFSFIVGASVLWQKITLIALISVLVVGPAIYHGLHNRSMGEDNTLLHLAIFFRCSREIIKALVDAGADVNAKNAQLNTPLHFAIHDLDNVHILLLAGAEPDLENHNQLRPLDLVKKPGVAHALLEAGARGNANWQRPHEIGSFRKDLTVKVNVGKNLSPGQFLCFISHHKTDAASSAIFFHDVLCTRFRVRTDQVFLDSNALEDIREIIAHVKKSKVLVILQTKNVLSRPFCLAEMSTAILNKIPIVAVRVEGAGYDYEDAKRFLSSAGFKEELESRNPGACVLLEEHGFNVVELGQTLSNVIPNIISRPFNPTASERVRASEIDDIIQAISEKI